MIQHHAISEHTAYGTPFITVDWSKKPRIEDVLSALETLLSPLTTGRIFWRCAGRRSSR